MADYLPTNTPRLKVLQTGPRGTHHMTFRFQAATSQINMIGQARSVCTAMLGLCLDGTAFESCELAAEGSDVFIPITWGAPLVAAGGSGVTAQDEYGRYVNFVGRSFAGSRAAYYLFNAHKGTASANNRLTVAELAAVGDVLDAFATDAINLAAIDQQGVVFKSYANTGINDAVAKKSRALA